MTSNRMSADIFFGLGSCRSVDDDRQGQGWGHWGHLGGWSGGAWSHWRGWGGWGQWERCALGIMPDEPDR